MAAVCCAFEQQANSWGVDTLLLQPTKWGFRVSWDLQLYSCVSVSFTRAEAESEIVKAKFKDQSRGGFSWTYMYTYVPVQGAN